MLGISRSQVFAHLKVGGRPKAAEIIRDLHRPIVGAQKMKQDGHPAAGNSRRVEHAKKLLQADGQYRPRALVVAQADVVACGDFDCLRCFALHHSIQRIDQQALQERDERDAAQLFEAALSP